MAPVSALETLDLAYLHSKRLLRYFTTSLGRSVHGEQSRVVGRPTYWYTLTEHTRVRCCTHSALGGTLSLLCHSNLFSCASSSLCRTAHHSTHSALHTPAHTHLSQLPTPPHITTSHNPHTPTPTHTSLPHSQLPVAIPLGSSPSPSSPPS